MTSLSLLAAAALMLAVGAVHSWLGERRLIGPLLAPQQRAGLLAHSAFARQVLRFAWHLTTLAWWGLSAMLFDLAGEPAGAESRRLLVIIAGVSFTTGCAILAVSRGRHLAWPVFLLIGLLALVPLY